MPFKRKQRIAFKQGWPFVDYNNNDSMLGELRQEALANRLIGCSMVRMGFTEERWNRRMTLNDQCSLRGPSAI